MRRVERNSTMQAAFSEGWTASPRHTDVYVITEELPLAALEGYVGGGRSR
jgi:hypothetical protein